jgi:hypothetical protein
LAAPSVAGLAYCRRLPSSTFFSLFLQPSCADVLGLGLGRSLGLGGFRLGRCGGGGGHGVVAAGAAALVWANTGRVRADSREATMMVLVFMVMSFGDVSM